jgi:arsenite methyltransferase
MPTSDIWSEWVLKRRFGGDPSLAQWFMERLYPVRDRVLQNASIGNGATLLDVGCGDGLIAFGALKQHSSVDVIFSDISDDLLSHARALAEEVDFIDRCRFVRASADNLSAIQAASVDAVTTRSVLIYVEAKHAAFHEFHRVLKSGGRLSIFEPINSFRYEEPKHSFFGFDVTPVALSAAKLKAFYRSIQPPESDPMLNFDERDLIDWAEGAGFREIQLDLHAEIKRQEKMDMNRLLNAAANPKIPTWAEAMGQILTAAEKEAFIAHIRPQAEGQQVSSAHAAAYLWAVKP